MRLGLRCGWRLCGLQPPAEALLVELQQRQLPLTLLLMPEEEVLFGSDSDGKTWKNTKKTWKWDKHLIFVNGMIGLIFSPPALDLNKPSRQLLPSSSFRLGSFLASLA